MSSNKINLTDSAMSICLKMSEGNPGALSIVTSLLKQNALIDPNGIGPFTAILQLDSIGIYGSEIWILYKDVCEEHISKLCALLRANQFGFISSENIKMAIKNNTKIDLNDLCAKVCKSLPDFNLIYKN